MKKETENIELQNEKRRIATEAHEEEQRIEREARAARRQAYLMGEKQPPREFKPTPKAVMGHIEGGPKTLKLFVKGDVSGSVEAVVETLKSIGNDIAKVVVIGSAVGDISKGDVAFAETAGGSSALLLTPFSPLFSNLPSLFLYPCSSSALAVVL